MNPNSSQLLQLIKKFSQQKILVIGDLMVDCFVRGKVSRISPEAPVPVVNVKEEVYLPGGAGNVMQNLRALGAEVFCCGLIGDDSIGQNLRQSFNALGIETSGIFVDTTRPTSLKTRVIAEHQQVVRFDKESTESISSSMLKLVLGAIEQRIPEVDGVILSDYGKGLLVPSLLTQAIALARKYKKPITVDPKIEHFLQYKHITCMTPNLMEAVGGMRRVKVRGEEDILQLGRDILKTLQCESVLITRGEDGMSLFEKNRVTSIPAMAREVFDVTGAGDTVISVLTLALAAKAELPVAAAISNLAAGIVVGKLGTATVSPQELKDVIQRRKQ